MKRNKLSSKEAKARRDKRLQYNKKYDDMIRKNRHRVVKTILSAIKKMPESVRTDQSKYRAKIKPLFEKLVEEMPLPAYELQRVLKRFHTIKIAK